jgi:hypothetical protein
MTPTALDAAVGVAASLITAAALVVAVLVWLATRRWSPTVPVLLELLLAAGLLRLSVTAEWRVIATAAAIVAIRTLVKLGAGARGRPTHAP